MIGKPGPNSLGTCLAGMEETALGLKVSLELNSSLQPED